MKELHPAIAVAQGLWDQKKPVLAVRHLHNALGIRANYYSIPLSKGYSPSFAHDKNVSAQHSSLVSYALKLAREGLDTAPAKLERDTVGKRVWNQPFGSENFHILAVFGREQDLDRLKRIADIADYLEYKDMADIAADQIRQRIEGSRKK